MTPRAPSYTVAELEEETGFDRRTIAYYVQEELLPRVGRRGPRTRYPKLVRDRLLFIRRVREAEEAGRVPPVSLGEIRRIFERVSTALIAGVADGRLAVTPDLVQEAPTAFRLPEMRRAALRERLERRGVVASLPSYLREPVHESPADAPPEPDDPVDPVDPADRVEPGAAAPPPPGLAELLARLQRAAERRRGDARRSMDTWTRIEISPDIVLSVRNISEEERGLLERVRELVRRGIAGD